MPRQQLPAAPLDASASHVAYLACDAGISLASMSVEAAVCNFGALIELNRF
jgi:hypothetical protein